jgi:hypothetical protein
VHGVAGVAQRIGETADGIGEPERVVEDDDLSHAQEHKRSLGISASAWCGVDGASPSEEHVPAPQLSGITAPSDTSERSRG